MILAIIAAGEGSRLKQEGIPISKPLVKIGGIALIDRLILNAVNNGITKIVCVINEESKDVLSHLQNNRYDIPIEIKVKSTPSSLHTMYELKEFINEPFLMGTVDSIFVPEEYRKFVNYCSQCASNSSTDSPDAILGITDFIDDETPLCVELSGRNIASFHNEKANHKWATGGVYYFKPEVFSFAEKAINSGIFRLRNLLNMLVKEGLKVEGFKFSKIIDIDHLEDIEKANEFLKIFVKNKFIPK